MDQPPPDQPPPDMPVAPPKLDVRMLWLTLLLPTALTAVFMALIVTAASGQIEGQLLNAGMVVVGLASLFGWVGFAYCIAERFVGAGRVLLILAYPIIQIVLVFCTFFASCLMMMRK